MVRNAIWLLLGLGTVLFVAFPHPIVGAILLLLLMALLLPGSIFVDGSTKPGFTASWFKPSRAVTATTHINEGNLRYAAGDYLAAIAAFNRAIQVEPNSAIAYCNRGAVRAVLGERERAIKDFNWAIHIDPGFAQGYAERGIIHADLGNLQNAIEDCDRAIQLQPQYVRAYFGRGAARSYQGDLAGAIADFTEQLNLQPTAATHYNIGVIHCFLNQHTAAIEALTQAINLDARFAAAYYKRGNAHYELGDVEAAQADFQQAALLESQSSVDLFPADEHGYFGRGLARQRLGNQEDAIADLQKAAQISQKHQNMAFHQKVMDALKEIQPPSIV